jgi:hypothetical protein
VQRSLIVTPHDVHHGLAAARLQARDVVLAAAFAARPERFPAGAPSAGAVPERGLDQQAAAGVTDGERASVISAARCLIHVDRFRYRNDSGDVFRAIRPTW